MNDMDLEGFDKERIISKKLSQYLCKFLFLPDTRLLTFQSVMEIKN